MITEIQSALTMFHEDPEIISCPTEPSEDNYKLYQFTIDIIPHQTNLPNFIVSTKHYVCQKIEEGEEIAPKCLPYACTD